MRASIPNTGVSNIRNTRRAETDRPEKRGGITLCICTYTSGFEKLIDFIFNPEHVGA